VTLEGGEEISFDHAAPYFTASSDEFKGLLHEWHRDGHAAPWSAAGADVWVGTPSNHAICRALCDRIASVGGSLLFGQHVRSVRYDGPTSEWVLRATPRGEPADEEHRFDVLVLSDKLLLLPNPYAVLAPSEWGPLAMPTTLTSTGTIALLLAVEAPPDAAAGAAASPPLLCHPRTAAPIERLVRDSSKPGRQQRALIGARETANSEGCAQGGPVLELYVGHSTAAYAQAHLNGDDPPTVNDPEAVRAELVAAALATLDANVASSPKVAYASVFAWDHAQPEGGLPVTHLLDAARRVGVCGDFCAGPAGHTGVEAAALSGRALARALAPLLS
jgi:hypothetical protein